MAAEPVASPPLTPPLRGKKIVIFGLPGETLASFAAGFDRLYSLRPHEIQLGLLKRLRGTPMPPVAYFLGKVGLVLATSVAQLIALLLVAWATGSRSPLMRLQ